MKIEIREEVKHLIDVSIESVSLWLHKGGITVTVDIEGAIDEHEGHLFTWEDILSWSQASSQEGGDVENILSGLRGVADALESWDNSFSSPPPRTPAKRKRKTPA